MAHAACAENGSSRPLMGLQKAARLPRLKSTMQTEERKDRLCLARAHVRILGSSNGPPRER